jgi:hypothetical protein
VASASRRSAWKDQRQHYCYWHSSAARGAGPEPWWRWGKRSEGYRASGWETAGLFAECRASSARCQTGVQHTCARWLREGSGVQRGNQIEGSWKTEPKANDTHHDYLLDACLNREKMVLQSIRWEEGLRTCPQQAWSRM